MPINRARAAKARDGWFRRGFGLLVTRLIYSVLVCMWAFAARDARAMTVEPTDFDTLLGQAQQIYRAQVVSISCDWSGEGANRHVATFVRLRVLESYRGAVEGEQTLEFFGGTIGERTQRIVGMPEFQSGDVEILFVRGNHTDLCPLVGVQQGRFRIVKNASDGLEQVFLHDGVGLTDVTLIGVSPARRGRVPATDALGLPSRALTTEAFGTKIRAGLVQRGITPDEP